MHEVCVCGTACSVGKAMHWQQQLNSAGIDLARDFITGRGDGNREEQLPVLKI
jgi:hypothetical protein